MPDFSHDSFDADAPIRVQDPGDFIASIPAILGFTPSDSLVVQIVDGPTLRVDLPTAAGTSGLSRHVTDVVSRHGHTVILVVVGGHDDTATSARDLISRLIGDLSDAGVETRAAWWVSSIAAGERWTCSRGDRHGIVPDPTATVAAAKRAFRGMPTYSSSAELQATLAQDAPDALERRARRLAELRATTGCANDGYELIKTAVEAASTGTSVGDLDEDTLTRIGYALTADDGVFGQCLLDLASDTGGVQSTALWTRLVQAIPGRERSAPAILLALAKHLSGDSPLANRALLIADTADPTRHLTRLLRTAFEHGVSPRELHQILRSLAA
ncbi:conserved hypothetical protein [Alloactinosynnema sp. L-07]|uniref:DUF4192 domain-containing protein n=1 Tax=Alloactinosynnema sp. L-07 TaxID=1653480 RepID=UPI00065EF781|nr:DUF4192 domain-containing protein [Alloactinosynnema sp. L-07]CRK57055.1 conserved hypothetical protein [Alloactinosynnema sp. L-07]